MTVPENPDSKQSDNEDTEDWMDSPSITEKSLLAACGRSVYSHLRNELENLDVECSIYAPAAIKKVSFSNNRASMLVEIPFTLPRPTGGPADWISSSKAVQDFKNEFQRYLREQRIARQLSNLFYQEFGEFLLRYLRVHRLGHLPSGKDLVDAGGKPLTVIDSLRTILRQAKERRLSGPRRLRAPKGSAAEKDKLILVWLEGLKVEISDRMKSDPFQDDASLREWLRDRYEADEYPWMKYLRWAIGDLGPKGGKKGPVETSLRNPRSWSTRELAGRILWKKWLADYGEQYPSRAIAEFLKHANKPRSRVK